MAKKKKSAATKIRNFNPSPFSDLKGFSVSADPEKIAAEKSPPQTEPVEEGPVDSFAEQMALLGVERLASAEDETATQVPSSLEDVRQAVVETEEEAFLQAMGELQVDFNDNFPDEEVPPAASPRRMKQLKQGKLKPQATLDLHGLTQSEVPEKLRFFLQNAERQGLQTVLVITGRGLHSVDGEPVLRNRAERFLLTEGRSSVIEWGRAPKHFGGEGALVLFLRKISG